MCTPKDVLDPSVDGQISYLCVRHDCSLLHFGDPVIGTVYDDRILVSSGQWWPLPRGISPSKRRISAVLQPEPPLCIGQRICKPWIAITARLWRKPASSQ